MADQCISSRAVITGRTESWENLSSTDQQAATQVLVNIAKSIAAFEHLMFHHGLLDDFVQIFQEDEQSALDSITAEPKNTGCGCLSEKDSVISVILVPCSMENSDAMLAFLFFRCHGPEDLGRYQGIETVVSHPFNQAGEWSDDPLERAIQLSDTRHF